MTRASYFLIAITLSLCSALGAQSRVVLKPGDSLIVVVAKDLVIHPPPVGSNEPPGMTMLAENAMGCFQSCGNGWFGSQGYPNAATLASDSLAPRSAKAVVQQNFTSALPGGSAPAAIGTSISAKKALYLSIWMRLSPNFVGHGSTANKVIHFYTAARAGIGSENIAVFNLYGSGTGPLAPGFILQNIAAPYQGGYTALLRPNLANMASCVVVRGRWHLYEMVLTSNTAGVPDGRAELWMGGVKCADYSGITFAPAGKDSRWNQFSWNPTWGGTGGVITTPFFSQVDHIYVSGK